MADVDTIIDNQQKPGDEHIRHVTDLDPAETREWLESLDARDVADIDHKEETKLLETRRFRFQCGCTLDRILPALGAWRDQPEELFKGQEEITIQCPRCAANFSVRRDMI